MDKAKTGDLVTEYYCTCESGAWIAQGHIIAVTLWQLCDFLDGPIS